MLSPRASKFVCAHEKISQLKSKSFAELTINFEARLLRIGKPTIALNSS